MSENKTLAKVLSALYGKKVLEKDLKDYDEYLTRNADGCITRLNLDSQSLTGNKKCDSFV